MSTEPGHVLALEAQLAILKTIFRPSSPTDDRSMFKGRLRELRGVVGAIGELGQHVVVYGERGVGKTSLAYMAKDAFQQSTVKAGLAVRIPCSNDDDFASVWKKLVARVRQEGDLLDRENADALEDLTRRAEDIFDFADAMSPDTVARALHVFSSKMPFLVILDEFDRIGDHQSTILFADLIKTLSDDLVPCTLVIVGVADSVDGLMQGHRSIDRAVKQIAMPRMTPAELTEIVEGGFEAFERRSGIKIELGAEAVYGLVRMSQGFPYYTHLLAGSLGEQSLTNQISDVSMQHVVGALFSAIEEATQGIRVSYTDAVTSPATTAGFELTLIACALTPGDELGFFRPVDVCDALSSLSGRRRRTDSFLAHLKRFAGPPSWILETRDEGRRTRYRFSDPLMRPFVMMIAVRDGRINMPARESGPET